MDLKIRQFQDHLIELINSEEMPLEIKRLVLKEVYDMVNQRTNEVIQMQKQELASKLAELQDNKEAQDAESISEDKLGE